MTSGERDSWISRPTPDLNVVKVETATYSGVAARDAMLLKRLFLPGEWHMDFHHREAAADRGLLC